MSILMSGVRLTKNDFLAVLILFFSLFSWYFVFSIYVLGHIVDSSTDVYLMLNASFNVIIVITLLFTSSLIHKVNKLRIIYASSAITLTASIFLLFTSNLILRLISYFAAGIFFSVGQLAFFSFFWSITELVERGRVSGLLGFLALPLIYIVVWTSETLDFFGIIMLVAILSLGPLVIKLLKPGMKEVAPAKKNKKGFHPEKRTILFYSIPWIVFSFINITLGDNISLYVLEIVPFSLYMILAVLQLTAAVIGTVGGGIIADFFGRKVSLIFSLTLFGISCTLVGVVNNFSLFVFVYFANGLNWGILLMLYLFVIWGDLANEESCTKIYSIGLIIFYLVAGAGSLFSRQISQIPLITSSLVSCLLIFLSNIPLLLAPELSSSDFREKIRLKLHIKFVKKIRLNKS